MKITIDGDIKSLIIDGKEMIVPKVKNLADEFLKYAGAKEYTGIVEEIQKWYYGSLVKDSWCATSLSYFANVCGLSEQIGKHENVDRMKEYMAKKGKIRMAQAYGGSYIPKKGDVVFFSTKNDYNDCTHVGTVTNVTNGKVKWIAGNTSDSIMQRVHSLDDKYVVCYGEVTY
jgi:hypothetical protein